MTRRTRAVFAAAAAVGAVVLLRRGNPQPKEHVDLYYDDGEVVTLTPSAPGADELFRVARGALASAT